MIERLKERRDFLAAAQGSKTSRRAFVLQAMKRSDDGPPRLGFTVSKRTAKKAVERNRIRRRLKEAARFAGARAVNGCDYVIVGRHSALTEGFADLKSAVEEAFAGAASAREPRRSLTAQRSGA